MLHWACMDRKRLPEFVLVAGLVLVFGWFGIDKFLNPLLWIGFMPSSMDGLFGIPITTWLIIVGIGEIVLAVLVILPNHKVRKVGAALMALHLIAIIFQVGWNDIGVRDIGLLASSVALLLLI